MPLNKMEHYLVLSDDIDATRDFYCQVLGLREGQRPSLSFPGYWIWLDDTPVIHIAEWRTYSAHSATLGIPVTTRADSTGSFDHIAFNGNNVDEMLRRLQDKGLPYHVNQASAAGLTQIFLNDPNGVKIELNYRD